jgi:3-deoxy-manno-octulosonate cytidylyltransferase (CMP-KDO synthetase)
MKIVIPARFASTRLPGKPLLHIAGRPMLQHVYQRASLSQAEEVVIATDDERIARAADEFSARVCMTSSTHASGTDRIAEVIELMGWKDDEIVVNLQGDEPLMPVSLLDQVAQDLAYHTDADTATLAAHLEHPDQVFDPNVVKVVMDKKGYALYFSRSPIPWKRGEIHWADPVSPHMTHGFNRHVGLYAYRAGFVREYVGWPPAPIEQDESLEQLRILWHGRRIHVSMAAELPPAGVDTADDLVRVESLVADTSGQ